jgi:hypothetical protein
MAGRFPFYGPLGKPYGWIQSKLAAARAEDPMFVAYLLGKHLMTTQTISAMKRDVKTVENWDFSRIVPCHGDVIETEGKMVWREAYKSYLD